MAKLYAEKLKKIVKLLKLDKPLVVFDMETTGLSLSEDRIVELAYIKVMPNGRYASGHFLFNPEMEIPEESVIFHGLTNAKVEGKPTFKQLAQEVKGIFENSYYGGFNIMSFGLPFLRREFIRSGINFSYSPKEIFDAKAIFHYMEPRTLSTAHKWYCGKTNRGHSGAEADTESAVNILGAQFEKYQEIRDRKFIEEVNRPKENNVVDDERKFYWLNGESYFNFSNYRDQKLSLVAQKDPDFLKKILKMNFSEANKSIIRKALEAK
jgi:DNA polymerase-3 subunit epsilon